MKRVLVVDDDFGVRRLASFVLQAAGYDVAVADNGIEALAYLERESADVVVLDLNMPSMDGYRFVREMEPVARPQILIISGDRAERARKELGADASLQKPFRPDALVEKVETLSGPATPAS